MATGDIHKFGKIRLVDRNSTTNYTGTSDYGMPTSPWHPSLTIQGSAGNLPIVTTIRQISSAAWVYPSIVNSADNDALQWVEINDGIEQVLVCDRNVFLFDTDLEYIYMPFYKDFYNGSPQSRIGSIAVANFAANVSSDMQGYYTIDGKTYELFNLSSIDEYHYGQMEKSSSYRCVPRAWGHDVLRKNASPLNMWDRYIVNKGGFANLPSPAEVDLGFDRTPESKLQSEHNQKWHYLGAMDCVWSGNKYYSLRQYYSPQGNNVSIWRGHNVADGYIFLTSTPEYVSFFRPLRHYGDRNYTVNLAKTNFDKCKTLKDVTSGLKGYRPCLKRINSNITLMLENENVFYNTATPPTLRANIITHSGKWQGKVTFNGKTFMEFDESDGDSIQIDTSEIWQYVYPYHTTNPPTGTLNPAQKSTMQRIFITVKEDGVPGTMTKSWAVANPSTYENMAEITSPLEGERKNGRFYVYFTVPASTTTQEATVYITDYSYGIYDGMRDYIPDREYKNIEVLRNGSWHPITEISPEDSGGEFRCEVEVDYYNENPVPPNAITYYVRDMRAKNSTYGGAHEYDISCDSTDARIKQIAVVTKGRNSAYCAVSELRSIVMSPDIVFETKPVVRSALAKRVKVIHDTIDTCDVEIKVTNNYNDANPVWEDYESGTIHEFQNKMGTPSVSARFHIKTKPDIGTTELVNPIKQIGMGVW